VNLSLKRPAVSQLAVTPGPSRRQCHCQPECQWGSLSLKLSVRVSVGTSKSCGCACELPTIPLSRSRMSAADDALRRQALPQVASPCKLFLPPAEGFHSRFSCLRGPYIAHYADSSLAKVIAYTVLRPNTHAARIDRLAQASEGIVPPQAAVIKIWTTPTPGSAASPVDRPVYMAVDTVPEILRWLIAIDGVCRVMRGDYTLPQPPAAVPAFTYCGRSHDSVSLSWTPVAIRRPAERVQAFTIEFWRMRHGDVVTLPEVASDLHSLVVPNPWQPLGAASASTAATPESGSAHLVGLLDDARIPGLSGGDITRCTIIGLRPRAKYALRLRAVNAAGAGLAGGEAGFAASLAASMHGDSGSGTSTLSDGFVIATTLGAPSVALPAPLLCQPQTDHLVAVWPAPVLPDDDAPCTGYTLHVFEESAKNAVEVRREEAQGVKDKACLIEDSQYHFTSCGAIGSMSRAPPPEHSAGPLMLRQKQTPSLMPMPLLSLAAVRRATPRLQMRSPCGQRSSLALRQGSSFQ
jgi:hypothetical protein